ncbi:unnamed protein product [Nippostrongylus brasiliensis]|uniref:Arrestin_N domain-containing protein n=1 Tax=Nippostrongylus brasiliensis TaxID=27835 RepID=A0A158R0Y0_NIPBR|nr:unnamed protein product [Nippostrongylus brasiliensis]
MAGKIHIWTELHVFHILDKDVSYTTNATVSLDSNDLGIRVQHSGNTVSFKIVDDIKVPGTDLGSRLELSCFDIKAWTRDLKHEWETIKNITSHIGRNRVKIEWECDGEEYLPERTYIIKFNAITGMQLKDRIATGRSNEFGIVRPIKYELEIRPKIDFELEEDILDIIPGKITINAKDEKPKQAPTNIEILAVEGKKFYVQTWTLEQVGRAFNRRDRNLTHTFLRNHNHAADDNNRDYHYHRGDHYHNYDHNYNDDNNDNDHYDYNHIHQV